jgi:hypothetical protein
MHRLPTFSSLDRAKHCPGSCALPQAQRKSIYAAKGDAIHDFVLSKKRGDQKLPDVPEKFQATCMAVDIDAIPTGRYEVAFGIDIDTGLARILGENLKREYPADIRAGELIGSADIYDHIKIGDKDAIYIGDVKTGLAAHVPPVRDCLQVGAAAVAAARIAGVDIAVNEIIRIKDNGSVSRETAILDRWALDSVELELTGLVRAVRSQLAVADSGGQVTVMEGDWCTFCPAFSHCPAKKNLAMALADPEGLEKEIMGALTPVSAPVILRKLKAAQAVINKIRSALYGYSETQEFDAGNGLVLGPIDIVSPALDAPLVHRILARDYGIDVANKAVQWKTSKSAVKAALRGTVKYGALAKAEAAVLTELQGDGGIIEIIRREIRAHRPGRDRQEDDE